MALEGEALFRPEKQEKTPMKFETDWLSVWTGNASAAWLREYLA